MKDQLHIKYFRWKSKEFKVLAASLKETLYLSSSQFYMPLFSLYYYVHNSPNSQKTIDFERKFYLHKILDITKKRYYNSNVIGDALIYDSGRQVSEIKPFFCKTIPILDPMNCINNNYNLQSKFNHHLPSGYNYNTFHKINDMNNNAYIDVFCSYLFGQVTHLKQNPSFPMFYGSSNGLGSYRYDITEEYPDLRMDKSFNDNIGKGFTLDMYVSDSESESSSKSKSKSKSKSSKSPSEDSIEDIQRSDFQVFSGDSSESDQGSDSGSAGSAGSAGSDSYSDSDGPLHDDYIALLKKVPLQLLFIEKLEGTLEDFLRAKDYDEGILRGCLFQVAFALTFLQKRYQFTHNDLHINNVMWAKTETKYLYYKMNNQYFRIPTHGKIFKIIDFGRAIFTFKKKTYMNDVFSRNGEAGGQYTYPHQVSFLDRGSRDEEEEEAWIPNYNFDLCRLAMTILEEIPKDKTSETTLAFLKDMCRDSLRGEGASFCDMTDDFNLYVSIARRARHALPLVVLQDPIFKEFRIKKKGFPRKSYYGL